MKRKKKILQFPLKFYLFDTGVSIFLSVFLETGLLLPHGLEAPEGLAVLI